MRWEKLFADLDAQMHAAQQGDLERQVSELARVEASLLTFTDALRGSMSQQITLILGNGNALSGTLERVGTDWLLLNCAGQSTLVPFQSILRLSGLSASRGTSSSKVRYPMQSALRLLSKNRAAIVLTLTPGQQSPLRGVIDQVGTDFLVLAQLREGVARRGDNWQGRAMIPLHSLLIISSHAENHL